MTVFAWHPAALADDPRPRGWLQVRLPDRTRALRRHAVLRDGPGRPRPARATSALAVARAQRLIEQSASGGARVLTG